MEKLVSIVIPVYNVEPYIDKCINSIIMQTYENLEILLIDDGSTDSSGSICEEYAKVDKRIVVYHKNNGGLSSARNLGIDYANGSFVTFIDSDDFVSKDYVETLLTNCKEDEISICNHKKVDDKYCLESDEIEKKFYSNETITSEEGCIRFFQNNNYVAAWGKMYPMNFFDDIRFPENMIYEDYATIYKLYRKAKRINVSNKLNYYYVIRSNSITSAPLSRKNLDVITVIDGIESTLRKENFEDSIKKAFCGSKCKCLLHLYYRISIAANSAEFEEELRYIDSMIRNNKSTILTSKHIKISIKVALLMYCANKKLFVYFMRKRQRLSLKRDG